MLKLAEGQGPQYDFGGVSTFVVPQPHFFFFLGYRIVVHSLQAKEPLGHHTNLRYAGTTA